MSVVMYSMTPLRTIRFASVGNCDLVTFAAKYRRSDALPIRTYYPDLVLTTE
jgi:hypothetical protein